MELSMSFCSTNQPQEPSCLKGDIFREPYSARWQHLSRLKASAFLFEFFLLGVNKHNTSYLRLVSRHLVGDRAPLNAQRYDWGIVYVANFYKIITKPFQKYNIIFMWQPQTRYLQLLTWEAFSACLIFGWVEVEHTRVELVPPSRVWL